LAELLLADFRGGTTSTVTTLLQGSFPSFSVTPDPLVFPDQALSTTSSPQTITLTNSGRNFCGESKILSGFEWLGLQRWSLWD